MLLPNTLIFYNHNYQLPDSWYDPTGHRKPAFGFDVLLCFASYSLLRLQAYQSFSCVSPVVSSTWWILCHLLTILLRPKCSAWHLLPFIPSLVVSAFHSHPWACESHSGMVSLLFHDSMSSTSKQVSLNCLPPGGGPKLPAPSSSCSQVNCALYFLECWILLHTFKESTSDSLWCCLHGNCLHPLPS